MKVDFWQLSRDPVAKVVALIASRVLASDGRLLVVASDEDQRKDLSRGLWKAGPDSFLANGDTSGEVPHKQPILLSDQTEPLNGANHVIFADGIWREVQGFERTFLLFDEGSKEAARAAWRSLDGTEDLERSFHQQENGKWVKVA